ncbi:MAG: hypothetical protein LBF79_04700 [Dysgonamonadaceae bacterium]|jgi:hypothetical protein|nr:hypothetical protein [Dysgonamonadaceae bacterium]
MAKKKKKAKTHTQIKLQALQYRKAYYEQLRRLCTYIFDGEPLLDLLPKPAMDAIYDNRIAAFKIRVEPGAKITKRFVKILRTHIDNEIKDKYFDMMLPDKEKTVSLHDYWRYINPLESVIFSCPPYASWREKFSDFCLNMEERSKNNAWEFACIVNNACYAYCDLGKQALYKYTLEYRGKEADNEEYSGGLFYQIITLGLIPLDVRHVEIRGKVRPVVSTGEVKHRYNESSIAPTTFPLSLLGIEGSSGDTEVPVYIQQHAVNRTMQRACCMFPGSVPSLIHDAFIKKRNIIREKDRYLVECCYYDIKIGYFVGMYVDGIFVILTFLLITHAGTPEGRKLAELTGLQRDDISFLAIDDLKTLINSDIGSDERIMRIFLEAGCESILDMNFQVSIGDFYWLYDESKQASEFSKLLAEYIQLGDSDDEYFENEKE